MSLNPTGTTNYGWNFSRPDREGYSTQLIGTVLAIQEVQKMSFSPDPNAPRHPEFWPDGNPKMNIRMVLVTKEGQLKTFTFQPAGKAQREGKKPSVHMDLFKLAGGVNMTDLIGKTIGIQTQEGMYGMGNPRPWFVGLVEDGPYEYPGELPAEFKLPQVLANNAVSGGQIQQPTPQMHGQFYAPPQTQQPYPYTPQQPAQFQPMPPQVPMQTPPQMAPQYPQGMNPTIANAMQGIGAMNVTEVPSPMGTVYDDEIPWE